MTKSEAEQYLFETSWYELARMNGQPMPPDVERKREEAYKTLEAE